MSMLYSDVHVVQRCPCCTAMSMLYSDVHVVQRCPCCTAMSNYLLIAVHHYQPVIPNLNHAPCTACCHNIECQQCQNEGIGQRFAWPPNQVPSVVTHEAQGTCATFKLRGGSRLRLTDSSPGPTGGAISRIGSSPESAAAAAVRT
eukprot:764011-Hanusia_phi.AAC.6